jgi:broad specificity phosphatase PhoE
VLIPNTVVYLVRHPVVHRESKGLCYGDSDVRLEEGWEATLEPLDSALRRLPDTMRPTQIWHSDLKRCAEPARWLADRMSIDTNPDRRLRERFFGTWQSVAWSAIPPHELEQAHAMLEHPGTFRPGGGETTDEVSQRALYWWREVVSVSVDTPKSIVAFAHSGSITSLCGNLLELPPLEWTPYYLKPSQYLVVKVHPNKIEIEV